MTRTTPVLRRALIAALAVVAAAAGPLPQLAHASAAAAPAEVTIAPSHSAGQAGYPVIADDASGYVVRTVPAFGAEQARYSWRSDDGSTVRDLGALAFSPHATELADGDTVLWELGDVAGTTVKVFDLGSDGWTTYTVPPGLNAKQVVAKSSTGWTVAATRMVPGPVGPSAPPLELHLLDPGADGGFTDRPVTGWPAAGATGIGSWEVSPGAAALEFFVDGTQFAGLLDPDSANLTASGATSGPVFLNRDLFGWTVDNAVELWSRSSADAAPRRLAFPGVGGTPSSVLVLTDAALLDDVRDTNGGSTVYSVPLDGGTPTALIDGVAALRPSADGGALMDRTSGLSTTATYKAARTGGAPSVLYQPPVYDPEHIGLSLSRGLLNRMDTEPGTDIYGTGAAWDLGAGAAPSPAQSRVGRGLVRDTAIPRCDGQLRCVALTEGGNGPAWVMSSGATADLVQTAGSAVTIPGSHGGRVVSAGGGHVVYDSGTNGYQYVLGEKQPSVLYRRPIVAAALWGDTLYSATATPGQVTEAAAATGTVTATVTTDAPCALDEIQALGRWLYWSCGASGPAGVWDATAQKSVPVPVGPALLGDGYVLRHVGGQLVLTDLHTGTSATDRVVAALPAGAYSDDRNITWTLDKFGDFLAYTDPGGTTHVLPSGVPHSPIGVLSSAVPTTFANAPSAAWSPQWNLTSAASWRMELRGRGTTKVVWSTWGSTRSGLAASWGGDSDAGLLVPNGDYTWTLTLTPSDGQATASTVLTGVVTLSGNPQAARDYTGDDVGDLLGLTSSGGIDVRPGTGTGGIGATALKATGWPAGSTFVPFEDLSGDGVNDLLVRDASGNLTRYDGAVGKAPSSALAHHLIGAGWNIYNLLTSPGDMNGDGRLDLLARDAKGDLYLYEGTTSGVFAPRVKIGYGYQIYDTIVGVQSLDGPLASSVGYVLARDTSGVLWKYESTDQGRFFPRARVGAGWNIYNAMAGVGDITGDGRSDLVARDTKGDLYLYRGDGRPFATRVKIGWAWQTYKSLI